MTLLTLTTMRAGHSEALHWLRVPLTAVSVLRGSCLSCTLAQLAARAVDQHLNSQEQPGAPGQRLRTCQHAQVPHIASKTMTDSMTWPPGLLCALLLCLLACCGAGEQVGPREKPEEPHKVRPRGVVDAGGSNVLPRAAQHAQALPAVLLVPRHVWRGCKASWRGRAAAHAQAALSRSRCSSGMKA